MKRRSFRVAQLLLFLMALAGISSCGPVSDSDTEKRIDGTWETTITEYEDGVTMETTEKLTYDASDHKMHCEIRCDMTNPMHMHFVTVTYEGTWSASKSKIIGEIDKQTIDFTFNPLLDYSDKSEFKEEIMKEFQNANFLDGGEIINITSDKLKIRDEIDDKVYVYKRMD